MDPHDETLLNDLLDDRLSRARAREVRGRIQTEPDLQEAWEELLRTRRIVCGPEDLRAPDGFLAGVRARIAAVPSTVDTGETGEATRKNEPVVRRPTHAAHARPPWLRWASAAAALLLVAVSARLLFLDGTRGTEEVLERASVQTAGDGAPNHRGSPETCETAGKSASLDHMAKRSGGARAPSPPDVTGRMREQRVSDNLAPSDEDTVQVYTLEATGFDEGRAQVALLLLTLGPTPSEGPAEPAARSPPKAGADAHDGARRRLVRRVPLRGLHPWTARVDDAGAPTGKVVPEVFGTIVLTLSPEEAAGLALLATPDASKEEKTFGRARGGRIHRKDAPDEPPSPSPAPTLGGPHGIEHDAEDDLGDDVGDRVKKVETETTPATTPAAEEEREDSDPTGRFEGDRLDEESGARPLPDARATPKSVRVRILVVRKR